ncbi:MAG: cytochrome C, partial [Nitrospirae bacterium]|nr:cytochrome C [Nitrospirota bacterium]
EGAVPYWRVAFEKQCGQEHSLMIGTYGMVSNISSDGTYNGPTNNYLDLALDAQYQYIKPQHIITAQATWIHEFQTLSGTNAAGGSSNLHDNLDTIKARLNYAYRSSSFGTIGGTLAWFYTFGTTDSGLYTNGTQFVSSASGSPNSSGFIIEADYLPVKYIKIALQYTVYTQFNGAASNYDGLGSNASGNNTIYLYSRLMF